MIEEGGIIAGRYRLLSLIGEGGMASVWRAEDQTLKRMVAMKLLYVRGHRDPRTIVDQFLREARIAASVQHRNVIHTVDFGVAEDQLPYMVMELLTGESLAERMQRMPALSMEEVVHIASLTLRGLAAVHEAGIVHRDLKPQNIFMHRDTDTVYPKILDFGISRSLVGDESRPSAISTQEGMIVGTPDYMSPEQARGETDIDKRADIYSMAAIIYEGVTGRLPFLADTIGQLIVEIVTTRPKSMREVRPDVPDVLSDVVAQAMSFDREERFIDAGAFRRALLSAADRAFSGKAQAPAAEDPRNLAPAVPGAAPIAPPPAAHKPPPSAAGAAAVPGAPAAGGKNSAWGDFEALNARAGQAAPASPAPSAVAPQAAAAAPPRAALGEEPASKIAPRDAAMLGDSPFDSLGGFGDTSPLDLDYGRAGPPPRAGRPVPRGGGAAPAASGPRMNAPNRLRVSAQKPAPRRKAQIAIHPLWIAPAILLVAFAILLLAPGLISGPAPDVAAGAELEARNPATADSTRQMQGSRRHDVGSRPPALRDVAF